MANSSNSNTPAVCVITARLRQSRHRTIKALPSFDKTDYSSLERELVSCLKQHYSLTHFADTEAIDWSLSATPFPARMNPRGHPPIKSSQSAGFLIDSFSFGKDLKLLQQFMADNPQIERFIINLFAKDPSHVKSDYLGDMLAMLAPSKGVVFYFCRKATRKAFQKEFGRSLCGLLQFSIQKYILESRERPALLDTQKTLTHLNSYLKARYLQSDDTYVQWTSELRVLTFMKSKGDKLIGIRFRQVPIKAAESSLSEDFPSSVPIITDILPNSPAANCPYLWINDHLLCIKGYVYTEGGKELETVISKCTYVQIVVQRAVRTYGPEKIAFITGKRQRFGITFSSKKNLYHGKLSTIITGFSPRAESEYLEKGLELKSLITSINDRPLSDLTLTEAVSILMQESLLQEQIKIRFCTLQRFSVGMKKDPGIGLALVTSLGSVQKLVLNESPSLPLMAPQTDDPLRSVFPSDAQHYDYLKVYILGVNLYEDVYELVGRLVNETRSPGSPLNPGSSCFQAPEFSPDLYPHCSLLGELFRSASSEERVLTELDLDADWRPVNYSSAVSSLQYPDLPARSPSHKKLGDSPAHRKMEPAPSAISSLPEFGLRRPSSIPLVTPSSSTSSLSSELAPDLLVRCSHPIGRLPSPAISLVLFRNTRELTTLSPPDLFPLLKRTGLYIMVVNLEKIFSFFENELHFYLRMLTELHSLPFPDPVKVLVVGLYDGLCDQTVRSLCRSLHWLLESLFNSHVVLDSRKFETCVFPICRTDRNMDTVYVLRQTLLAFSRANAITQETDFVGMLRIPDNFKKFRVCSLFQSAVPLLLSEQIGQILVETEVPDHQLEIALRALVECTPFCAPETLSDLSEEGLLLRPGIFFRVLRQLERWSGGQGLDRTPEQREVCKQLRENCYFNLSVLIQAIMQSCFRMIQIARALLRWMEKLHFVFLVGGPVSLSEFEKLSQYKAMTPKPGTKTVKVFMPGITLWNDYKKVDNSTVFSDAHVFYVDISDPISSRFYFLLLAELLRMVHRSNSGSLSPTGGEPVTPPLYDFNLFRGANIARLFDQEMLGCNLEIINHHDQFQVEFRAKFGATPSQALPSLLSRVYSCALRALARMSLMDKGFNIAIGPACPVVGCPGKRKTAELSKATISFVQVINDLHPARTKGINFPEVNRSSLPCWGRPGVHVIDLSTHFRHPIKTVTHYSQCRDRILALDTTIACCPQHKVLRDWVPHDVPL